MNNEQIEELKEQIKQELLAEMNTRKRVGTVWEMVKEEYKEQIKELNKIPSDNHSLEDTIRTIIRAIYGVRSVANIKADYEEVKTIVENILKILKDNKKESDEKKSINPKTD